jgi:hypothetical protein
MLPLTTGRNNMPFVEGTTLTGWGVVRNGPWHFVGIYPTKEEAEAKAAAMGPEYEVHYGENREGSDDFLWTGDN